MMSRKAGLDLEEAGLPELDVDRNCERAHCSPSAWFRKTPTFRHRSGEAEAEANTFCCMVLAVWTDFLLWCLVVAQGGLEAS